MADGHNGNGSYGNSSFDDERGENVKGNGKDDDKGVWPEVLPLYAANAPENEYPLDILPQRLRDAVTEYKEYGQQPTALIASSVLASTSLSTQGLALVGRDKQLVGPIGLFLMLIAESGERKTASDKTFKGAILNWQRDKNESLQGTVASANANKAAWKAEHEGILSKIKKAAGGKPSSGAEAIETLKEKLCELELDKPLGAFLHHLFFEDTNLAALVLGLSESQPSSSVWSDEGGLVIGMQGLSDEQAMGFFGFLNRMWDGGEYDRTRVVAQGAHLQGRALTTSLMMQPKVLDRFLGLDGGVVRGMGLLARFLPAWPDSTIGTRMYREPTKDMPAVTAFGERLRELLDMPFTINPKYEAEMALDPPILWLSASAKKLWIEFHNATETDLRKGRDYGDVSDIGAKTAEQAARIAAVFHVFEHGPKGEISERTFGQAMQLANWYLEEAKRILTSISEKPLVVRDAEAVLKWAGKLPSDRTKNTVVDPVLLLHTGPHGTRNVLRRDAAIRLLTATNYFRPLGHPGTKKFILNPNHEVSEL